MFDNLVLETKVTFSGGQQDRSPKKEQFSTKVEKPRKNPFDLWKESEARLAIWRGCWPLAERNKQG